MAILKIASSPWHLKIISVAWKAVNADWSPCLSPSRPGFWCLANIHSISVSWEIVTAFTECSTNDCFGIKIGAFSLIVLKALLHLLSTLSNGTLRKCASVHIVCLPSLHLPSYILSRAVCSWRWMVWISLMGPLWLLTSFWVWPTGRHQPEVRVQEEVKFRVLIPTVPDFGLSVVEFCTKDLLRSPSLQV